MMKTPISYYGGKQNMLKHIKPLIPQHKIYVEPFFGGGALFFNKTPGNREIINDINDNVINFYRVLQTNYIELKKQVNCTLHSRSIYNHARVILKNPGKHDSVMRAWAFWAQIHMSFGNRLLSAWGYGIKKGGCSPEYIYSRKERFAKAFSDRLRHTIIENNEAHKVIQTFDTPETFHYVDPPYISADQGPYKGYKESDFIRDLDVLVEIKGKFLLSSYPEEILNKYRDKHGWRCMQVEGPVLINNNRTAKKRKIECLTWNYDVEDKQGELF